LAKPNIINLLLLLLLLLFVVVGGGGGSSLLLLLLFKQFSQLPVMPVIGLNSHKIGLNLILRTVQFVNTYKAISVAHDGERKRRNTSPHVTALILCIWFPRCGRLANEDEGNTILRNVENYSLQ
jgi:hypothetical protein